MLTALIFGLFFGLIAGLSTFFTDKKSAIVFGSITFVVATLLVYWIMPVIGYGFYGIPILVTLFGLVVFIYSAFQVDSKIQNTIREYIGVLCGMGISIMGFVFLAVIPFVSTPVMMNNAENYQVILSEGEVDGSGVFDQDISHIDPTQVRLVDQETARKLAETKLGEDPGLGSRVEIGTMNIQDVNGKLYWIGPLEWSSIWRWAFGADGTPGFVAVSASNQRDIRLIQDLDGVPISLELGLAAFWYDNLLRHVWNSGYQSTPFTDPTFEVDGNWRPHWVLTKYEKTVGYAGQKATGVIVVDPQTREIQEYSIKDAPKWIDRIQPEEFVAEQIDNWGKWVHGYWNNFANLDKKEHTPGGLDDIGLSLVWSDGRAMYYTGVKSVGSDQGTTGFMMVDSRTGQAKYYNQAGITEAACKKNIHALVSEKPGWSVSNCILYNVGGHPTYIAIIKDADGNPKEVGIASVVFRDVVVSQRQIQSALRAFRSELRSKGNTGNTDSDVDALIAEGTIVRSGTEVLDGTTYYYLVLNTEPNRVFVGVAGLNSSELPITQTGDKVVIEYDDNGGSKMDMTRFVNQNLNFNNSADDSSEDTQDPTDFLEFEIK